MKDDIETLRSALGVLKLDWPCRADDAVAALERLEKERAEQERLYNDAIEEGTMKIAEAEAERDVLAERIAYLEGCKGWASISAERDALRAKLDARWEADLRAAKAIFLATGRTQGFPDTKEVVAYYIAEAERLECEVKRLRSVLAKDEHTIMIAFEDGDHQRLSRGVGKLQRANYSLRALLERAKEALDKLLKHIDRIEYRDKAGLRLSDVVPHVENARAVLSELSANAPAQQTQISDEAVLGEGNADE